MFLGQRLKGGRFYLLQGTGRMQWRFRELPLGQDEDAAWEEILLFKKEIYESPRSTGDPCFSNNPKRLPSGSATCQILP